MRKTSRLLLSCRGALPAAVVLRMASKVISNDRSRFNAALNRERSLDMTFDAMRRTTAAGKAPRQLRRRRDVFRIGYVTNDMRPLGWRACHGRCRRQSIKTGK